MRIIKHFKRTMTLLLVFTLLLVPLAPVVAEDAPHPIAVERIEGSDRYETSLRISQAGFTKSTHAVIASGETSPDALAGGQLAGYLNAPLLVTPKNAVSDALFAELERLGVTDVYLLGGNGTIDDAVQVALAEKFNVKRLAGTDRFATSQAIAAEILTLGFGDGPTHYANGYNFPDALAAAPFVVSVNSIMHLVDGKTPVADGVALGGSASVPGTPDRRIAGTDRYATAVQIAVARDDAPTTVILVDGTNFPDALSASGYAKAKNIPILLTPPKSLAATTAEYMLDVGVQKVVIIGGKNSVSNEVAEKIAQLNQPEEEPDTEPPATEPPATETPDTTEPPTDTPVPSDPDPDSGELAYKYANGRIIGNVNSGIYHMPHQRDYKRILLKNAIFFNTEKEAQEQGFRRALR